MRLFLCGFSLIGISLFAQDPQVPQPQPPMEPGWRQGLISQMAQPPSANLEDVKQFDENLRLAPPWIVADDAEANRELVRRVTAYLAAWDTAARTPQMKAALRHTNQTFVVFRAAVMSPQPQPALQPPPPPQPPTPAPQQPPPSDGSFEMRAPEVEGVPDADKAVYHELQANYEAAAIKASTATQAAESIRQNLTARGMSLNSSTASSLARLHVYLDRAQVAFREKDWAEARASIQRVEAESDKVLRTFGR